MGEINKAADFHPLSHVLGRNNALLDPILQGDVNLYGDTGPGTGVYNHAQNLGATDMLGGVQFMAKSIAGGAALGAAGGGEAAAGADLEAAGTSAEAAGAAGSASETGVAQAQAASVPASETETLGSGGSQMPAATPEPAGGPTAPGGSAGPNATMPPAMPEPEGGPTAPGGSAESPPPSSPSQPGQNTDQPNQPPKPTDQTQKQKLFDSIRTAANILSPVSSLLALAAGKKKPSQAAPPSAPPPAEMPVSGTGKNSLSAPIVERSIIQAQIARRGRASTILTSDDKLGS